jgi:WD40 repeat protein
VREERERLEQERPPSLSGETRGKSPLKQVVALWAIAAVLIVGGVTYLAILSQTASGRLLATFQGHTGPLVSAVFSPDGRRVLTASYDNTARLWEVATGRLLVTFQGHTSKVNSTVFSPDGRQVLTASGNIASAILNEDGDNTARFWEVESGKLLTIFRGHTREVTSAVFNSDGRRVLTASWDTTARLWEAASGRLLVIFQGHTEQG